MVTINNNQGVFSIHQLIDGLDVTLQGDDTLLITGVATIQHAKPSELTFLANAQYCSYLKTTHASAIVLSQKHVEDIPGKLFIISKNPYYIFAKIAQNFLPPLQHSTGIHPSAVIGAHCTIHPSAYIGANCVIGDYVQIGANCHIGPGSVIASHCHLANDIHVDARVTLYPYVQVGSRSRFSSGVVLGSAGFGFANEMGIWHAVPQLASVVIGEDVDIGANTTIDCGALENTIIGNGVKLDNQIQIGHNVHIGDHTIIAGCSAVAGSTIIGKHCMIGGACSISGHIEIADQVCLAGGTSVYKSISEAGVYASVMHVVMPIKEAHRNTLRLSKIDELNQRVKTLEKKLDTINKREAV